MEAGREVWHLMDTLSLPGCRAGVAMAEALSLCPRWSRSGGKLHAKLGTRVVLGESSHPPRSEVDTGMVNNHHHLHLGHS